MSNEVYTDPVTGKVYAKLEAFTACKDCDFENHAERCLRAPDCHTVDGKDLIYKLIPTEGEKK